MTVKNMNCILFTFHSHNLLKSICAKHIFDNTLFVDVDKQKLAQTKAKKKNRKKQKESFSKSSIVHTSESKSRTIPER